jgi:uncharacterized protein YndB with AHSA1/START domain
MAKTEFTVEPGKQEVVSSRVFNAPRDLVFKAYTDPNHIPNWWGPRSLTTRVDKMEVRPGGLWRFVQRDESGNEYAFFGVYHSIQDQERTISTFEFEGMPGHVILETTQLETLPDGKTRVVVSSVFQSLEDRDGMIQSGMEVGSTESWDRLDELLPTL